MKKVADLNEVPVILRVHMQDLPQTLQLIVDVTSETDSERLIKQIRRLSNALQLWNPEQEKQYIPDIYRSDKDGKYYYVAGNKPVQGLVWDGREEWHPVPGDDREATTEKQCEYANQVIVSSILEMTAHQLNTTISAEQITKLSPEALKALKLLADQVVETHPNTARAQIEAIVPPKEDQKNPETAEAEETQE